MLNRQKILLSMLKLAGRPVGRVELVKWCFLLRYESPSEGGSSFYDFVPYKLGPFSFALSQEMQKLDSMGYVSQNDHAWNLNLDLFGGTTEIHSAIEQGVRAIVSEFSKLSNDDLLNYVYDRYPAFTVNSERQKLACRTKTKVAVYTAGYEGISVDGFLNMLVTRGIERLIDVRSNPIARRYGFHKSTLQRLLSGLNIEYIHFAELGIESKIRQNNPFAGDRGKMFDEYECSTLANQKKAVEDVAKLVNERPSVLVCMEAEPACCHRSRLANPIAEITRLPIVHLRPIR